MTKIHVIGCTESGDLTTSFSTITNKPTLTNDEVLHNTDNVHVTEKTSENDFETVVQSETMMQNDITEIESMLFSVISMYDTSDLFGSVNNAIHIALSVFEENTSADPTIISPTEHQNQDIISSEQNTPLGLSDASIAEENSYVIPSFTEFNHDESNEVHIDTTYTLSVEADTTELPKNDASFMEESVTELSHLHITENKLYNIPVAERKNETPPVKDKVTPTPVTVAATTPTPRVITVRTTTTTPRPALPVDKVTPKRRQNPHLPIAIPTTPTPRPTRPVATRRPRIVWNATITQFPDPDNRDALVWGLVVTASVTVCGLVVGIVIYFHYKRGRGHMNVKGTIKYHRGAGTLRNPSATGKLEEERIDIENLGPKDADNNTNGEEEDETVFEVKAKDYQSTRRRSPSPASIHGAALKKQETMQTGFGGGGLGVPEAGAVGGSHYRLPGTIPPQAPAIQGGDDFYDKNK